MLSLHCTCPGEGAVTKETTTLQRINQQPLTNQNPEFDRAVV